MAMIWGTLSRRGSLMRNPVVGRFEKPSPFAGGRPGFERLLMPCRGIPSGCPTIHDLPPDRSWRGAKAISWPWRLKSIAKNGRRVIRARCVSESENRRYCLSVGTPN
jgi:hypothetical protein